MSRTATTTPPSEAVAAAPPARTRIVCILPAYNEAGKIGQVVGKIRATGQVDEVVVVDDCSTDRTGLEATDRGATVLRHKDNAGVGAAIRTGLYYGRDHGFDIAVIMSGDDQHEPSELPRVLDQLLHKRCDFVQGSRRRRGGTTINAPLFREVSTRVYSFLFTLFTFQHITDCSNGFRAFRLTVLDDLDMDLDQGWLNTYELEPYLLYKAIQSKDVNVVEVPITIRYHAQARDYSKMRPIRDWWRLVRPLFYLRFGIRK